MAEIQCFDGDGVVPPEIKALIAENTHLKTVVGEQQAEIDRLNKFLNLESQAARTLGDKLWQIQNIVNAKDMVEDEYPLPGPTKGFKFEEQFEEPKTLEKDDPRNVLMHEKVPIKEAFRRAKAAHDHQSADEMFRILTQKGDA